MRALYLYFVETADTDRRSSSATDGLPQVDDGPLTPIQPGAFSRWMASRGRVVDEARVSKLTRGAAETHAPRRSSPWREAAR